MHIYFIVYFLLVVLKHNTSVKLLISNLLEINSKKCQRWWQLYRKFRQGKKIQTGGDSKFWFVYVQLARYFL